MDADDATPADVVRGNVGEAGPNGSSPFGA